MIRLFCFCLLACSVQGVAAAQTALNPWGIWPDDATWATRLFIPGTHVGDVTVHIDAAAVRGVGATADPSVGRVLGLRGAVHDLDRSTSEDFGFCILGDDPASPGRPDASSAGELLRISSLSTPADSGTGAVIWTLSITLATPADVLPTQSSYHIGMELSASDEMNLLAAHYSATSGGDNPKPSAPNLTHAIDRSDGSLITPSPRTMNVFVLTDAPVLSVGADIDPASRRGPNPNFGVAGLFPYRFRQDGLAFRVGDASQPGGMFAVFASTTDFAPRPIRLPGFDGAIHLQPPLYSLPVARGTLDTGMGEAIAVPGPYPLGSGLGRLEFQAVILDVAAGSVRLTNAVRADDR